MLQILPVITHKDVCIYGLEILRIMYFLNVPQTQKHVSHMALITFHKLEFSVIRSLGRKGAFFSFALIFFHSLT